MAKEVAGLKCLHGTTGEYLHLSVYETIKDSELHLTELNRMAANGDLNYWKESRVDG